MQYTRFGGSGGGGLPRGPHWNERRSSRRSCPSSTALWARKPLAALQELAQCPEGALDLPTEQPRLIEPPVIRLLFDQISEAVGGSYNSPERESFEHRLLASLLQDPEHGYPTTPSSPHPYIRAYQERRLGSRQGHVDLNLVRNSPQARSLGEKWVREGVVVQGHHVHVRYAPSLRPTGTVKVLICDLHPTLAVQGVMATLLSCAGYSPANIKVVSEFLGAAVIEGQAIHGVGRSDVIVAFVEAPATDPLLHLLPDSFSVEGSRVYIAVEGRDHEKDHGFVPCAHVAPPPVSPPAAPPAEGGHPMHVDSPASTPVGPNPAPAATRAPMAPALLSTNTTPLWPRGVPLPVSRFNPDCIPWRTSTPSGIAPFPPLGQPGELNPPALSSPLPTLPSPQAMEVDPRGVASLQLHPLEQQVPTLQQHDHPMHDQQQQATHPFPLPPLHQQQPAGHHPPPPPPPRPQRPGAEQLPHGPAWGSRRLTALQQAERDWERWRKNNSFCDDLAYALDDYDLPESETKEGVIRDFFAFMRGSPKLLQQTKYQGSAGAGSIPKFASAWLADRFQAPGYGSDASSEPLVTRRRSGRQARQPDPDRMYGSSTRSRSPVGGPA